MQLSTDVRLNPMEQRIVYGDKLLFLGSCFADEVGLLCKGLGFDALVNPSGVLFNPASIAQCIKRLHSEKPFSEEEIIPVGGAFYTTFSHNSDFWMPSEVALLDKANAALAQAAAHFKATKWVVLSLGTSWIYRYKKTGEIVSNCHKLPASEFEREFLSVEQSVACLSSLIKAHPDKRFILTVSPLRHLKDGLHENALSKSALLLAADQICHENENAAYFPAYEIMMDELRDYRFYKEDMVHPTEQAVKMIWERFVGFGIAESALDAMKCAKEVKQMLQHKPFFPESDPYRKFEALRESKMKDLSTRYPKVILENL